MKQKFLFLVALVTLAVNVTVAGNYVPDNDLKLLGKSEKAEFAATLQTDKSIKANRSHKKGAAIMRKSADEGWGEWEAFAPGGSNDAVWTLTAWQTGKLSVKTYVRTSTTDATKKQIKCAGWGAGLFTAAGVDILLDWNTTDNTIEIPMQSTGYYVSNYNDYAVLGTFRTGKYDPEQGKFTFYVGYSVPQYYVMVQGFGFRDETLQMAGNFKDYDISFTRGTVDDSTSPVKQTVNVVKSKDITSYRVHYDTYENYAAAGGSTAYLDSLASTPGEDYTGTSATIELEGSDKGIYVVVVSGFADGVMKKYDYAMYEVHPDSEWESLGMRPYCDDIVTSLYNFGVTGYNYEVEIQKHKTIKDIFRIKNPYGTKTDFKNYTLFENAYIYINAQNPKIVSPTFHHNSSDLGIDVEGGMPLNLRLADQNTGGTYDGYVITFPKKALASNNYYVNTNGLFRAVINFRSPVIAVENGATSVLAGETVKITSDNTFKTPTYESLTPELATVDANGVVTCNAAGVAKIRVSQDAKYEFNAVDTTLEIEVLENPFVYGDFIFNTDEGLAALGIEKPESGSGTNITGMTLKNDVVSMTSTDGTNPTRVWNNAGATDLRMYKNGGSFTISVPTGYKIISIDLAGAACNYFAENDECGTCTKTQTVWDAPEGESVTSKTFTSTGTGKISTITVKYMAATNTLTAGYYEITATITANEGVEAPSEMQKYLGGYTAQGELTGDSLELVISTFEEGFILNGFSVKGDAVILNDEAEVVFNGKHFQLADAKGNTNGALAITKTGEYEYALADGTIVYMGNVVGTVTGITFKMIEDPTTGINSVDAKAVKSGKFLENGKLVIIKNGVKYNVIGINE